MVQKLIALTALVLAILTGCIDYTEEVWINPDGTGKIRVELELPEWLASQQQGKIPDFDKTAMINELESDPNVTKADMRQEIKGSRRHLIGEVEVQDLASIKDTAKKIIDSAASKRDLSELPDEVKSMAENSEAKSTIENLTKNQKNDLTIEDLPNGDIRVKRVVDFNASEAKKAASQLNKDGDSGLGGLGGLEGLDGLEGLGGLFGGGSMFKGHYVTYVLHGKKIYDTNGELNKEATSVTWKIPLEKIAGDEPFNQELVASVELTRGKFVRRFLVPVLLIGVLLLMVVFAAKGGKKPEAS